MEPVGIQGLPPLMPSIPSVVPVAIPESGSEAPVSTLTELVPVRTAKQTTAAQCLHSGEPSQEGSSTAEAEEKAPEGETAESNMLQQQPQRSASGEASSHEASASGSPYPVPPHLLGRSLENPLADPVPPGRKLQKPRLGVRVPHRNLTSQIVSQNELAQELLERSMKKLPLTPEEFRLARTSGYPYFTQKIAERLSKTLAPAANKLDQSALRTPSTQLKKASFADTPRLSPGFTYTEKSSPGGDAELLSILEGDGDPLWLPDKLVKKEGVNLPRSHLPPPMVLDPALERELALKQLEELPVREHKRRSKAEKNEEPRKKRPYKRKRDQMETSIEGETVNGEEAATPSSASATVAANRKKKMTPDVAAVLKKPPAKAKKTVKAVTNGKAPKGGVAKKTPKVVLKKKGAKPAKSLVANGTAAKGTKDNSRKRGRPAKKDEVQAEEVKKPAPTPAKRKSQTPAKSAKTSPPGSAVKKNQTKADAPSEEMEVEGTAEEQDQTEVSKVQVDLPDEQPEQDVPNVSTEAPLPETAPASKPEPAVPTRVRELDRLLGDEGAVNLLFDVDSSSSSGAPSRRAVPSKDLALRARLVKTAVLRLSQTSQGHVPLALRARRSLAAAPPRLSRMGGEPRKRQGSVDSRDAPRSPPSLTPMDVSPSHRGAKYMDHSRMKLTADASRIIRRHSSSSTFSSPSVSPRRLSVDVENADADREQGASSTTPNARKRGVPIFVRDKETTYSGKKKARVLNPAAVDSTALSLSESARKLLELQVKSLKGKKALVPNPAALKKKDLKKISSQVKNKVKSEMFKNFKKGLDGAVVIAAKKAVATKLKKGAVLDGVKKLEPMDVDASNVASRGNTPPPSTSKANSAQKRDNDKVPLSPDASSYSNLIKTLKHDQKTRRVVEDRQRASVRHCAGTYTYRELTVRRYDKVVQIIMAPVSTKIRSGLNIQVLRELRDALHQVKKDDSCRVVLLTSTGASFCQGIDVSGLLHNNVDKRKTAAIEMIVALKDFLKSLASFPKPIIAGVHGPTIGLGVTMLPLFDMVFASDKATFHTPYARLGQVPEGAATLTLPYMLGYTLTSELLLGSREMTASEALNCGLVTRTLWPDRFLEELVPLVKTFASQSAQSMEATKALLRHGLRTKFDAALESESHLLVTHWTSNECQESLRRWLESGSVALQRPRLPDA